MNDLLTVTEDQRALVKNTLAPEATNVELELFFYDNKRRGVHPLDRLIHFTKRQGRYVPITSIHFMRAKADEGGRAGQDPPAFQGKEMLPDYACAITVYKFVNGERVPYIGIAKWKEYYPGNEKEGFMWRKMPSHMLAKCAEANALRLGFPRELAGLHIEEEAHVLDESQPAPLSALPERTLKDKLKAQIEKTEDQLPDGASRAEHEGAVSANTDTSESPGRPPADAPSAPAQAAEAPASSADPAEPYRVKLRVCERTKQAMTHTYNAIPEELRQDCHTEYQAQLRSLDKKK